MVVRSIRFSLSVLALAGLAAASAPGVQAQVQPPASSPLSEAPLQGVVVDEATYQPVQSATVAIVGTNLSVATSRWGAFAFPDVPPGPVSLHVSAPGHPSMVQDFEVREDRIVFAQIVLPSVAAVLAGLLVPTAQPAGPAENARSAADLLALQVPRARINTGIVGANDYQLNLRPGTTFQGNTTPLVLIDGVVLSSDDGAFDALERIPAGDVAEIQVLKGPAAAFLYPYAANGVVNVVTKRGARR